MFGIQNLISGGQPGADRAQEARLRLVRHGGNDAGALGSTATIGQSILHHLMAAIRNRLVASGTPLNQLKITLRYSKPPIWRRVVVRADMTLDCLHLVIQTAMGWLDCHLHQFRLARVYYGIPDREFDEFGGEMLNEKHYTVADLAPAAKQKFIYEYDFGEVGSTRLSSNRSCCPTPPSNIRSAWVEPTRVRQRIAAAFQATANCWPLWLTRNTTNTQPSILYAPKTKVRLIDYAERSAQASGGNGE